MDKLEYRAVIRFFTLKNLGHNEIHNQLLEVYGNDAPSLSTVKYWSQQFRFGRKSIHDEERTGRPPEGCTNENVDHIAKLIEEDKRIKIKQISTIVGLSNGTVHHIIHELLGHSKLTARWVPKMLSLFDKQRRVALSREVLEVAYKNPEDFLSRLITVDESWVHFYDPCNKLTSMEWRAVGSSGPVKFKAQSSAGKVLLTVFWDSSGVLLTDFMEAGKTINGIYYANLLDRLRFCIREKRRGLLTRGVRIFKTTRQRTPLLCLHALHVTLDLKYCRTLHIHLI